jgi:hypothetical protein
MSKYERIDRAAVAAARRVDILAGRTPAPKLACNFCGAVVGRGALWCSSDCAREHELERQAVVGRAS